MPRVSYTHNYYHVYIAESQFASLLYELNSYNKLVAKL